MDVRVALASPPLCYQPNEGTHVGSYLCLREDVERCGLYTAEVTIKCYSEGPFDKFLCINASEFATEVL